MREPSSHLQWTVATVHYASTFARVFVAFLVVLKDLSVEREENLRCDLVLLSYLNQEIHFVKSGSGVYK